MGGKRKVLSCGTTDVTTDKLHAQIKLWNKYMTALGELVCYNTHEPRECLQAYFYGNAKEETKDLVYKVFAANKIEVFTFVIEDSYVRIINYETKEVCFVCKEVALGI